jgi:hypothetical protein
MADSALAIGAGAVASAAGASAIGDGAVARIQKTVNLSGPVINRKDNGEAAGLEFETYAGASVVLMTKEIDFKVVADHFIYLPSSCAFFCNEIGVICTAASSVNGQPYIRLGWTGTPNGYADVQRTDYMNAVRSRERLVSVSPDGNGYDGKTSLQVSITQAASASSCKGRVYFVGLLVENE